MDKSRLRLIRDEFAHSASDFASMSGIEIRTYNAYERGERKPSFEFMNILSSQYNVNLHWLLTGQGRMFLPEQSNTFKEKDNEKVLKNYEMFGYRLAEVQEELGYLDKAMARIMGCDEKTYMRIKLGKEDVTGQQLAKLASKVDVSLDWLVKGE